MTLVLMPLADEIDEFSLDLRVIRAFTHGSWTATALARSSAYAT